MLRVEKALLPFIKSKNEVKTNFQRTRTNFKRKNFDRKFLLKGSKFAQVAKSAAEPDTTEVLVII